MVALFGSPLVCKQWGSILESSGLVVTFPIQFPSTVFAAYSCIEHDSRPSYANTVYKITTSGMIVGSSSTSMRHMWLAIGMWQWGKFLPAHDGWTSGQVNFPITFGSACLAVNVSVVMGDDKNDFESAVYHSPGLTSFGVYYSARRTRPIFWIAIGYWQWGITNDDGKATFPTCFH